MLWSRKQDCLSEYLPASSKSHKRECQLALAESTVSRTGARPEHPIARAPAGVRSMIRPLMYGSLMRTITERPVLTLVTLTIVPKGRVLCAAVRAVACAYSPLAVFSPL